MLTINEVKTGCGKIAVQVYHLHHHKHAIAKHLNQQIHQQKLIAWSNSILT